MPTRFRNYPYTKYNIKNHGLPEGASLVRESSHAEIEDEIEEVEDDYCELDGSWIRRSFT